jgi:capsule polysaccharide export protein KpsE/RkpR
MKLATALSEFSDMKKEVAQLRARAKANAIHQEGEQPVEDPNELATQVRALMVRLSARAAEINMTNAATTVSDGRTITQLLAKRDQLNAERGFISDLADCATPSQRSLYGRRARSELKDETLLDVPVLRAEADRLAREYRQLDDTIQAANWATEMGELKP